MNEALERDLELWAWGLLSLEALELRHPDADVRGYAELHRHLEAAGRIPLPDASLGWQRLEARLEEHPIILWPVGGNGAVDDTTRAAVQAGAARETLGPSPVSEETTEIQSADISPAPVEETTELPPAPLPVSPAGHSPVRRLRRLVAVGAIAAALLAMTAIAYAAGPPPIRRGFDRFVDIVQQVTPFLHEEPKPSPTLTGPDAPDRGPRGTAGTSRSGDGGSRGGAGGNTRDGSDRDPAPAGGSTRTKTHPPQGTFDPEDGSFTYGTPPPHPSSWPTRPPYPTAPPYPTPPPQPTPTPTPAPTQTATPQEQTAEPSTTEEPSPSP